MYIYPTIRIKVSNAGLSFKCRFKFQMHRTSFKSNFSDSWNIHGLFEFFHGIQVTDNPWMQFLGNCIWNFSHLFGASIIIVRLMNTWIYIYIYISICIHIYKLVYIINLYMSMLPEAIASLTCCVLITHVHTRNQTCLQALDVIFCCSLLHIHLFTMLSYWILRIARL